MWHPENTHAKGGDPEVVASMWELVQPNMPTAGVNKEPAAPSNEFPGLSATMIYAARLSPASELSARRLLLGLELRLLSGNDVIWIFFFTTEMQSSSVDEHGLRVCN